MPRCSGSPDSGGALDIAQAIGRANASFVAGPWVGASVRSARSRAEGQMGTGRGFSWGMQVEYLLGIQMHRSIVVATNLN